MRAHEKGSRPALAVKVALMVPKMGSTPHPPLPVPVRCCAHLRPRCLLGSLLGLGLNPAAPLSRPMSCAAVTWDVSLNPMYSASTKP